MPDMAEPAGARPDRSTPVDRIAVVAEGVAARARAVEESYEGDEERPLGGYLVLMSVYLVAVATSAVLLRRRRVPLPSDLSWSDLVVGAIATHRISRLLTKDPITSPIRAPFTRYDGLTGPAELREQVRSQGGVAHAVGELLTCPFCVAQWVATVLAVGRLVAPRATRAASAVFATVGLADMLHLAYDKLES